MRGVLYEREKNVSWGLVLGGLALVASGIWIYTSYQAGTLGRLRLPSIIFVVYKALGVELGAIIQSILGALMIFFGFKGEKW